MRALIVLLAIGTALFWTATARLMHADAWTCILVFAVVLLLAILGLCMAAIGRRQ